MKEILVKTGTLSRTRAHLHKKVFEILNNEVEPPEEPPPENTLINALIYEYLTFNHYDNTAEVLNLESGQPRNRLTKADVMSKLGIQSSNTSS
ncbi:unnamed protein product [Soboliphyme baturini]|uniref:Uncharacterized protein n=1 Tax=Soboliphyme baturini TaxID=241478 RepID=A0A3P8EKZ3_9BILA|nr:unnamed protein product [Soboliphyme baturini]